MNIITFVLESDNNEEINFNQKRWPSHCVQPKFELLIELSKLESDSYCVGGKSRSATSEIYGDITSKGSQVVIGYRSICNRKKSMTVSDNITQIDGLCSFFRNLGRISAKTGEKLTKIILKKPSRALDNIANLATASRQIWKILSTLPGVINFYHTGEGL